MSIFLYQCIYTYIELCVVERLVRVGLRLLLEEPTTSAVGSYNLSSFNIRRTDIVLGYGAGANANLTTYIVKRDYSAHIKNMLPLVNFFQ
jgi:hypothetical protein